jgi:capsular exopolysaccharide synthesis family protein
MDQLSQPTPASGSLSVIPAVSRWAQQANSPGSRYGAEWNDDCRTEASVLQYWRIVRRHRKTVFGAATAGFVLGILGGIPIKPVYRARTTLEVLSFNDDFMNAKQTNPVSSNGNSVDASAEENQAKLLESNSLLQSVSSKLGGSPLSVSHPDVASGWRSWLHLPAPVELTERERLVGRAADSLKVQVTQHTHLIEATVESSDRRLAADFANTLASEFMEQSMQARWSASERTGKWLGHEIDEARAKLRSAENAMQAYARQSGLIFSDDNSNVATEKLQDMQRALWSAANDRIAKQSRFDLAKTSPPDALVELLSDDPSLRETNTKMNDLRRQIAVLTAFVYTPKYGKVKEAQAELAALQAAFERERADILKKIDRDYKEATRKEALLEEAYNTQVREVTGQSEKTIQYNILKRDVESSRELYDNMLQQMKQAAIAAAVHVSNVRVVDRAETPNKPVFPDFRIDSALGGMLGVFISVFVVIIRDQTDRSFRQPEEIKFLTDLPVLGTIPSAAVAFKLQHRFRAGLSATTSGLPLQPMPNLTAEAFRSTLASILFLAKKSSGMKVLVFTSANVADGKTTSVSNLAIAAAEVNKRVLIVDADLRRPRIHELFDLANDDGLSKLLRGEVPEERMMGLIQETSVAWLDVLTAGPATESAPHLLYSPRLNSLLRQVESKYDLVLIDTPPMLHMPDARVVGALADAVVLIVRASQTDHATLIAAQQRFLEDRINLLGTILNGWDPTRDRHAQSYYHEYRPYRTAASGR